MPKHVPGKISRNEDGIGGWTVEGGDKAETRYPAPEAAVRMGIDLLMRGGLPLI
jgi:hypothetical protein